MAKEKLWAHELDRVWSALGGYPRLGSIAVAHRGERWTAEPTEEGRARAAAEPIGKSHSGIRRASDRFEPYFIAGTIDDLDGAQVDSRAADGLPWHLPKAIVHWDWRNHGQWLLTAVPDYSGLVAFERFHGVWPTGDVPPQVVAAILNGYVANAYAAGRGGPREDGSRALEDIPIPPLTDNLSNRVRDLVGTYRSERAHLRFELTREGVESCLEIPGKIDDLVLKAYGLPPAVEAELLGHFAGEARPGFERVLQIARRVPSPLPSRVQEPMSPEERAAWLRSIDEADAAMEAGQRKLEEQLRSERPDLFDASGAFRADEAQRRLVERLAQKKEAARAELAALVKRRDRRSFDAP